VAVGPGVEDFKTGDKVVAVLSGSVSAHSLFWCFFFFFLFPCLRSFSNDLLW
jgi:hypothetical protein